ncbi:MAG: DUF1905 domain-containing protein [Chloroflexi bacterium]|nr:DUF1905 domain-containing protein [Chloroflexota bacterium]
MTGWIDVGSVELAFSGEIVHWRGPSPYHFITMPHETAAALHALAPIVSYGWGVIPVSVKVRGAAWETSLIPRSGSYLVPVRDVVRRAERFAVGDTLEVQLSIRK